MLQPLRAGKLARTMRALLSFIVGLLLMTVLSALAAAQSLERGKEINGPCAGCHGRSRSLCLGRCAELGQDQV